MRKADVAPDLSSIAFNFFFWFSRFECALKEGGYLKSHVVGSKAEPGWEEFIQKWHAEYECSMEAKVLLNARPERQMVGHGSNLTWQAVDLSNCKTELAQVVRLLQTVRNNLFHGGKSGGAGWDNPERTRLLLSNGLLLLNQLCEMAGMEADYQQFY